MDRPLLSVIPTGRTQAAIFGSYGPTAQWSPLVFAGFHLLAAALERLCHAYSWHVVDTADSFSVESRLINVFIDPQSMTQMQACRGYLLSEENASDIGSVWHLDVIQPYPVEQWESPVHLVPNIDLPNLQHCLLDIFFSPILCVI